MLGLLLYDLFTIRKLIKIYGFMTALYIITGIYMGNASTFGSFIFVFALLSVSGIFGYRERAHWDLYANSMPVSRKEMVIESYIYSGIMIAFAIICNIIMNLLNIFVVKKLYESEIMLEWYKIPALGMVAVIYLSVFLPIMIKFGAEKGRVVMTITYLVPILLLFLFRDSIDTENVINILASKRALCIGIISVLMIFIVFVSINISLKAYNSKDLE